MVGVLNKLPSSKPGKPVSLRQLVSDMALEARASSRVRIDRGVGPIIQSLYASQMPERLKSDIRAIKRLLNDFTFKIPL